MEASVCIGKEWMVVVGGGSLRSELATAQLVFEIAQLVQGALAAALLFGRRNGWRRWRLGWRRRRRGKTNAADIEVFLETVQLQEIR